MKKMFYSSKKTGAFMILAGMLTFSCGDMELKKSDPTIVNDDSDFADSRVLPKRCLLPDAAVSDIHITRITGNTFSYTFKVSNVGGATLPLSQMFFQTYVSQDSLYNVGDPAAGGAIFFEAPATLAPGQSYVQSWYYNPTTPEDITLYKYLIITVAPFTGKITECSTSNNIRAQLIGTDIPRNGLVAFYPFTGNVNDATGHGLHGTLINGPALAADRYGNAGRSYSFDGVNDYITMGNPSLLQISNQITVSGWYNVRAFDPTHAPGHAANAIITKLYFDPNVGGNPRRGYTLMQDYFGNGTPSASNFIFSSDAAGNVTSFLSSYVGQTMAENEWVFFCIVIDGTSYKYYHNNTLTHAFTMPNTILTDGSLGDFNIGTYGGGFIFNGWIDDVAIYNRALSQPEVLQLFNQTITQ